MKISEGLNKAINEQINKELYSSYLYLAMSAWFESVNLKGFSNWMQVQAKEEYAHALKFFNFIYDTGGNVELEAIAKPKTKWNNAVEIFEETCKHEAFITASIYNLFEKATQEKDFACQNMLQWFIAEQVEEEATAGEILAKLQMIGQSKGSLFYIDKELDKRGK